MNWVGALIGFRSLLRRHTLLRIGICLSFGCLATLPACQLGRGPDIVETREGAQYHGDALTPIDFDGNGQSELIVFCPHKFFVYAHADWLDGGCLYQINFLRDTTAVGGMLCMDLTGDGSEELVLPFLRNNRSFLRAYSHDGGRWESVPVAEYMQGDTRLPSINATGLIETQNGKRIIYGTSTGFLRTPRTVGAIDTKTGESVWSLAMSALPQDIVLADVLDSDGVPEIIVGTFAANNEVTVDGTKDDRSSILLIDAEGNLVWRKFLGGPGSWVECGAGDLDADGTPEIWSLLCRGSGDEPSTELQVRDPRTGAVRERHTLEPRPKAWRIADLDADGRAEFIFALPTGELQILTAGELDEGRHISICDAAIRCLEVADLNGDGLPEIICGTSNQVRILDRNFKLKALGSAPCYNLLIRQDGAGQQTLFIHQINGYVAQAKIVPPPTPPIWRFVIALAAALFLIWVAGRGRRRWQRHRADRREVLWDRLLLELRELWHGGSSRDLLVELKRAVRTMEQSEGSDAEVKALAQQYHREAGDRTREVLRLAARLGIYDSPRRRRTLAQIDEPIKQLGSAESNPQTIATAHRSLERALSVARKQVRINFSADVMAEIHRAWQQTCEKESIPPTDFRLTMQGTPRVFLRPVDLRLVLIHLFENAAAAMAESARRELTVEVAGDPVHTRILIRDTGIGIPRSEWEKRFEPGITTKAGHTGQGLALCRERLGRFRGTLQVLESAEGMGTTMDLRLETVHASTPFGATDSVAEQDDERRQPSVHADQLN